MKRFYTQINLVIVITVSIFLHSCVKDSNTLVITNPQIFKGNIINLYNKVRSSSPTETYTIDPTEEQILTSKSGIRLAIPSNAFTYIDDKTGEIIISNINLSILELNKKSDWVRFAQYSNTSGYVINWYKTLSISATSNGKQLKLLPGKEITIQIPEENPSVNWKLLVCEYFEPRNFLITNTDTYKITSWTNGGSNIKGLEFNAKSLSWYGIGTSLTISSQFNLQVNLPDNFRKSNTAVIVSNPDDNVIYYLNNLNLASSSYKEFIHTNKDISVLVISDQGDDTYYGSKDYYSEITEFNQNKVPTQKSYLEIEEYINGL